VISSDRGRSLGIAAAIALGLLAAAWNAHADDEGARFCVVPIKDGVATIADANQAWRITRNPFRIPGLPSLVFTPVNRRGQWTVGASRRLVPYVGSFPHSIIDRNHWVREPWSSRIVAFTYDVPPRGGGVSTLMPGTGFEKIADGVFDDIAVLPRRKITVVTSSTGTPTIVGDHKLTPWFSREQMDAHDIKGIYSIHDASFLNATVVVDLDRRVYVLTDNDEWYRVGALDKKDYGPLLDGPGSQGDLLAGNSSALYIRKDSSSGIFRADVLDSVYTYGASFPFRVSSLFGQVLTYRGWGLFGYGRGWRRLTDNGFENIPDGNIGLPRPNPYGGSIQDLPTIGRTLIEGQDGLFLYDGNMLSPIAGAEQKAIGDYPVAYDLPSIGRVVVITENGFFNLTEKGSLVAIKTPFPPEKAFMQKIADWPDAGVALVSTRSGLFTLDADLVAKPIQGGGAIEVSSPLSPFTGINPSTGEMVLTGTHALFLAVDTSRSHDGACRGP
jgi:hypothetical protein